MRRGIASLIAFVWGAPLLLLGILVLVYSATSHSETSVDIGAYHVDADLAGALVLAWAGIAILGSVALWQRHGLRVRGMALGAVASHVQPSTARFAAEVVARGEFEHDWFTVHVPIWDRLLRPLVERTDSCLLELGSFEGLSACYLLWRLPHAHLTCVDTFNWFDIDDLEERFDRNVALVGGERVRKLTGRTCDVLPQLVDEQKRFDFIYIDASHHALDVLADAAHAWKVLAPEGLIVFDDYGLDYEDPLRSPTRAVDAFRYVVASEAARVDAGGQFALRKVRRASSARSARTLKRLCHR